MSDNAFFHFVDALVSLLPASLDLQCTEDDRWSAFGYDRFAVWQQLCMSRMATVRWTDDQGQTQALTIDQSMDGGISSWRGDEAGRVLDAVADHMFLQLDDSNFRTIAYGN